MDIAQEPFFVEIYRKNAARPRTHLDQTQHLFTLTVRIPSGRKIAHCLGEKRRPDKNFRDQLPTQSKIRGPMKLLEKNRPPRVTMGPDEDLTEKIGHVTP